MHQLEVDQLLVNEPFFQFKTYIDKAIDFCETKLHQNGRLFFNYVFPYQHIQTLLIIGLVQVVSLQTLKDYIPVVVCYGSFGAMVYFTLKLFRSRLVLKKLESWHKLIGAFQRKGGAGGAAKVASPRLSGSRSPDPGESAESPDSMTSSTRQTLKISKLPSFLWATLEPAITFFTAVCVFVLSYSLCDVHYPNNLFLFLVCFVCTVASVLGLPNESRVIAVIAILVDTLSTIPVLRAKYPASVMANLPGFVIFKELVSLKIGGLAFSFGLGSLLYFTIPMLYVGAVAFLHKLHWREWHRILIPHFVTFFWWQCAMLLVLSGRFHFDPQNVALTLGLVSLVFWPTMAGLAVVLGVLIAQLKASLSIANVVRAAILLCVLSLPFVYKKGKEMWDKRHGGQKKAISQVILCTFVFSVFLFVFGQTCLCCLTHSDIVVQMYVCK